jgi:hypothetical protein
LATLILAVALNVLGLAAQGVVETAEPGLASAAARARSAFLALSAMKSAVAVVEGSSVMGLEIGDVAQPAYDLVDMAWSVSLGAWLVAEGERQLLGLSSQRFADLLAILGLVLLWMQPRMSGAWSTLARRFGVFLLLLGLCFRFLVPSAAAVSGSLASLLTADRIEHSSQELESQRLEFPDPSAVPLLQRPALIAEWLQQHDSAWWKSYMESLLQHAMWLAAGLLLEAVVFPLIALVLIWQILRRVGAPVLEPLGRVAPGPADS